MVYEETNHTIVYRFQVSLTRCDDEDRDQRYEASVSGLSGCTAHAASKAEALRKIRKAIGVWLDRADRLVGPEGPDIEDLVD